jgi:hypothetical protein
VLVVSSHKNESVYATNTYLVRELNIIFELKNKTNIRLEMPLV